MKWYWLALYVMCYVVGKIKINKCKKNIYIQVLLTFSSMGLNQYDLFDLTSLKKLELPVKSNLTHKNS